MSARASVGAARATSGSRMRTWCRARRAESTAIVPRWSLHDPLDDREPEPAAVRLGGEAGHEQLRALLPRRARRRRPRPRSRRSSRTTAATTPRPRRGSHRLEPVLDQVDERLPQLAGVRGERSRRRSARNDERRSATLAPVERLEVGEQRGQAARRRARGGGKPPKSENSCSRRLSVSTSSPIVRTAWSRISREVGTLPSS